MESQRQHSRGQQVLEAAYLLVALGAQLWAVWVMLPPQQRMWIKLDAAGLVRRLSGTMAWKQGHAGMGAELQTGHRSIRYLAAWGLSTVRDRANSALEAMRP